MIYFMQDGDKGPIKIGFTNNHPIKRLQAIKPKCTNGLCFLKIVEGDQQREKELHKLFWRLRIKGEWFKPHEALLSFINNQEATELPELPHTTNIIINRELWTQFRIVCLRLDTTVMQRLTMLIKNDVGKNY